MNSAFKFLALSIALISSCVERDPHAVNPNCPLDAPCFLSVVAPRGQTAAPGPYTIVAEVTGPNRIEGVGLVLSINGAESLNLDLARLTSSDGLWGVPDLEDTSVDPPKARLSAEALAALQPGDEVSFLLWAWDQMGNQTQWMGEARNDTGSVSFRIVGDSEGSALPDAGLNPSEAGTPLGDAAVGMGDAAVGMGDASVGPVPPTTDAG
jgi:hypothetical protein